MRLTNQCDLHLSLLLQQLLPVNVFSHDVRLTDSYRDRQQNCGKKSILNHKNDTSLEFSDEQRMKYDKRLRSDLTSGKDLPYSSGKSELTFLQS